jgi:hypothetical protein
MDLPEKPGGGCVSGQFVTNSGKSDSAPEMDVPTVAYVRMSTDHQKYSTENQVDAIRSYASARGLPILRLFEDSGRSGLRPGYPLCQRSCPPLYFFSNFQEGGIGQ